MYEWSCEAYCLTTHFHLLVSTAKANLAAGMQQLSGRFARTFDDRHERRGHLFEGRYGAVLVETDEHYLQVVRYIHLNPVAAGICRLPEDSPWSSHRASVGLAPCPVFLQSDGLLAGFGDNRRAATDRLRRFVLDGHVLGSDPGTWPLARPGQPSGTSQTTASGGSVSATE